jgi:hypothetical protein
MIDDTKHDDYEPPGPVDIGQTRDWVLPLDAYTDGKTERFRGQFLGMGSSHRDTHINHEGETFAPRGTPCSGCRWFESRIFTNMARDRYLLYTVGESIVDGEEPRYRAEWVVSPYEVIDLLVTFRPGERPGAQRQQSLSYAARRALAQAAHFDDVMRDAYEGRTAAL